MPFSIYAFMPIWGLTRAIASRLTSRFLPSTVRHLSLLIQFLCWPHLPSLDSLAICYAIYRPPRFCSCLPNHNIYVNISTVCMSYSKLTAGFNGHVVPTCSSALDPANYPRIQQKIVLLRSPNIDLPEVAGHRLFCFCSLINAN